MAKGKSKIAEQIDDYGIFGSIELDCSLTNGLRTFDISCSQESAKWKLAVSFGVSYFLEHVTKQIGLNVKVIDIESHEVDTNDIVVTYLTILALTAATGYSLRRDVFFDKKSKSFVFPK